MTFELPRVTTITMNTTYSYTFTHHSNLVTTDYKFVIYKAYSPYVYDVISEFYGLEALNHYRVVQDTTPDKLQKYLRVVANDDYDKKCAKLADKRAKAKSMREEAQAMRARAEVM
jgi:hypothetical protein